MDLFDCMPHFADDDDDDITESETKRIHFDRNAIFGYFTLLVDVGSHCHWYVRQICSPFQLT